MLEMEAFVIIILLWALGACLSEHLKKIADALESLDKERKLERDRMNRWPRSEQ